MLRSLFLSRADVTITYLPEEQKVSPAESAQLTLACFASLPEAFRLLTDHYLDAT